MSGNKNKLIAFNYFGGKFTWLEYLYENFPSEFTHMVDLFAGSMVVSINYTDRVIRTANEINGEITNFFLQLREHEDELVRMLELTPCSELEYQKCWGGLTIFPTSNALGDSMSEFGNHFLDWAHNTKTKDGIWPKSTSTPKAAKR